MNKILWICLPVLAVSCVSKQSNRESALVSIQIIDRNGFAETISTKDRLIRYQNTDFSHPQPYQKVLRVFGKNEEGRSVSVMTGYHSNGYIRQYLDIVDGRAHGIYREWHANGKQKFEFMIMEGMADLSDSAISSWVFEGCNRVWNEEGELEAQIFYEKGMLEGVSSYYYPSGELKKQVPYRQDKLEGEVVIYSSSGVVLEKTFFQNDLPQGRSFAVQEDGSTIYEEIWDKGILLEGSYFVDGQKIASIHEGNGKRAEFDQSRLSRLIEYRKGKEEGSVEIFTDHGLLYVLYHQKEGKKHGKEIEYYSDGHSPKIELHWHEDLLQGQVKTWYPDGRQESQKELYQNKKNGSSFAWYKSGDLMLHEEYENDQLVSGSYYKKSDKKAVSRISNGKGTATLYDPEGYFLKKIPYEKGIPLLEEF